MILPVLINLFHWLIIAFILFAPFSKLAPILLLHITGIICLLVHWAANNDICFLTLVEAKLRNIPYNKGFLHKFISPIYNISNKQINTICNIIVIITMLISFYNLLESEAFQKAKKCYEHNNSIFDCLIVLFEN